MKTGNDMSKMKKILALAAIALCLAPVAAQAGHPNLGSPIIGLPDAQLEIFAPTGEVSDQPASDQDGADTSGADLGIGLCGAGGGAGLMFGLMGLVGMHGSSRSRRKARNQRKARRRQDRATNN